MAYATRAQITALGLPSAALANVTTTDQDTALDAASGIADSYFSQAGYDVPLVTYGMALTSHVCAIAAWVILKTRGFDPENPADKAIRMGHEDAIKWLESVAAEKVEPVVTESVSASATRGPEVWSDDSRGW